ncbi:DUF4011 domain-containing protein [Ureaplasma diversum]|uniref:DUF4011 domain-containing protein n=1 Tax=Ureaplasma diversum TaxID=42094 RepID=UPI000AA24907|nr:DUF4011 domain-containing protein [Ureaplasma diversum]
MNQNQDKIIVQKLANLLGADSRDSCIKTRTGNNHFDLSALLSEEELESFFNNQSFEIKFKSLVDVNSIEKALIKCEDFEDFSSVFDDFSLNINNYLSTKKINDLAAEFELEKAKKINDVIKALEAEPKKFENLARVARSIYNETGIWPLYLAKNFLVGNTAKPTSLNAPMVLVDVEIKKINNSLVIRRRQNAPIGNEKLLHLLKKDYKDNIVKLPVDFSFGFVEMLDLVKKITNKQNLLSITNNQKFLNLNSSEIKQEYDQLYLYDATIIGIYEPMGGAIKADVEKIIELGVDPFDEIINDPSILANNYHTKAEREFLNLVQINRPLNIYQKYAIHSSLVKNTLIYGPPGTGKSQVIANIIANVIVNHKNCLIVSEKKAALDVLKDRLNKIAELSLFLYDIDDKEKFYMHMQKLLSNFNRFWFDQAHNDKIDNLVTSTINSLDTNKQISKLKQNILNLEYLIQTLYKSKSASNYTFKDYINWLAQFSEYELKQWKNEDLINSIKTNMSQMSYSFSELITSIKQTREFMSKYDICIELNQIQNLIKQKQLIDKLQSEHLLISKYLKQKEYFTSKAAILETFLKESGLYYNNQVFVDDQYLLKTKIKVTNFLKSYEPIINQQKDLKSFLINNETNHKQFVLQLSKTKESIHPFLVEKYVYENIILEKKGLFVFKKTNKPVTELLQIKNLLINYVNNPCLVSLGFATIFKLQEIDDKLLASDVILYLANEELFNKPYFLDLYKDQFDHQLNSNLIDQFSNFNMSANQFETICKILDFEREVLIDFDFKNNPIFDSLCNSYLKANNNFVHELDSIIYQSYINYLYKVLVNLNEEQKNKIKKMMRVINLARKPAVSKFVYDFYDELKLLFPIWISKPENVSEMLPLAQKLFDYGIFDEASQMFLERSYPILFRCALNIVAGDEKQLKPTNFFSARANDSENDDYDIDQAESLLDRTKASLWTSYWLKNHYRSKTADLIDFSNHHIYNNELLYASLNGFFEAGIEVIDVLDGEFEEQKNTKEAEQVIKTLNQYEKDYKKIIIVTFNNKQSELIETLILNGLDPNSRIYQRYNNEEIIVTNLENVQGNEADLVIISNTYAKNKAGVLKNNYGPLMKNGGANRLNVAITRASAKMIVIKSIQASDLVINVENENMRIYKQFIAYCDQYVSNKTNHNFTHSTLNYLQLNNSHQKLYDILNQFKKNEHSIWFNVTIGNYKVNFALYNNQTNQIDLLVVLNELSNSNELNLLHVYDQFSFFVDLNYKIAIINEYELYLVYDQIKLMIEDKIKTHLNN